MSGILCFINYRGDKAFCSRVQGEFHGKWDGRRWTHDISSCTSEQFTFGQWSYFPTDLLSEISNNLIWSYLKCCLRLISCSHGCDHVCGVVAWRFCLCGADEFTSPIDFFVLPTWILKFFGGLRRMTVPLVILLSWSEMGVCVCVCVSELEFGCLDLIFSGCRMFDASVTIMYPGFTKPVGTGPAWPVTGYRSRSGSGLGRYQTGPNSKFKFELKKWKIPKKFLKILQGATNLMVSNFLENSFI